MVRPWPTLRKKSPWAYWIGRSTQNHKSLRGDMQPLSLERRTAWASNQPCIRSDQKVLSRRHQSAMDRTNGFLVRGHRESTTRNHHMSSWWYVVNTFGSPNHATKASPKIHSAQIHHLWWHHRPFRPPHTLLPGNGPRHRRLCASMQSIPSDYYSKSAML